MQKLNKSGQVEPYQWSQCTEASAVTPDAPCLVSCSLFLELAPNTTGELGVWITPEDDIEALAEHIHKASVVAIDFPVFADGRGFSTARWVREKLQFKGEIHAVGHFMQDQLHYLKRCGFDAFIVADDANIASMAESLNDFSDAYQASAEQPVPLFRRRSS